jgi:alkyl hydroperoxide reductase subunit AhpC
MMSMQFFAPRGADGKPVQLPLGYRKTVKWLPRMGDIFPDFTIETTQGMLKFWDWAEGGWTLLFSHPAAFTPVCTTELAAVASQRAEFATLGLKVLALTGSTLDEQRIWHRDIERAFDTQIWFPTAEDQEGSLAELFGMKHEKEHAKWPIRKTFILDPQMKIRMIFEYPVFIGRSVEETLRVVEALQLRERTGAARPADWFFHDPIIIPDDSCEAEVKRQFRGKSINILPYLRVVNADAVD